MTPAGASIPDFDANVRGQLAQLLDLMTGDVIVP